jgi:hypothetical protein
VLAEDPGRVCIGSLLHRIVALGREKRIVRQAVDERCLASDLYLARHQSNVCVPKEEPTNTRLYRRAPQGVKVGRNERDAVRELLDVFPAGVDAVPAC